MYIGTLLRRVGAIVLLICVAPAIDAQSSRIADSVAVHRRALAIVDADNDRDLQRVIESYAMDAVLVPPGESVVRGREHIRPRYQALFAAYRPELRTIITEVRLFGDSAIVRGRNTGVFKPLKGGPVRRVADTYTETLERGADGVWRITRLTWHPTSSRKK